MPGGLPQVAVTHRLAWKAALLQCMVNRSTLTPTNFRRLNARGSSRSTGPGQSLNEEIAACSGLKLPATCSTRRYSAMLV